jgi:uncharacterized protein
MLKAIVLPLAAICCMGMAGVAQEAAQPHVTVHAAATTKVRPDRMYWLITVRNKALVLHSAAEEHTRSVAKVLELLRSQEVSETDVQTARMQFGENREYREESWVQEGYFAETTVSFTLVDFERYEPIWMGLSSISNVNVHSVLYDHSRRMEYQNETRSKAVVAAREKASTLAAALGATIGEPLSIEEQPSAREGWEYERLASRLGVYEGEGGADSHGVPLERGKIPISVRVRVSFKLMTHDP